MLVNMAKDVISGSSSSPSSSPKVYTYPATNHSHKQEASLMPAHVDANHSALLILACKYQLLQLGVVAILPLGAKSHFVF